MAAGIVFFSQERVGRKEISPRCRHETHDTLTRREAPSEKTRAAATSSTVISTNWDSKVFETISASRNCSSDALDP
jgi:hypothetical protein